MPLISWSDHDERLTICWSIVETPEHVWSALTTPKLIEQWLGKSLECDITTGGRLSIEHGNGYVSHSKIKSVEISARLEMTWEFPDESPSELLVELSDGGEGSSTTVCLEHSGLGDLLDSYRPGWMTHLSFLEAAVHGAPLPTSQFWNLHTTMNTLTARS